MFSTAKANPYDEIVAKTTDENLTSENWELILNLCDKVNDEGEQGARNVIASVLKRLAHRNSNVQIYALALGEALSKNCGLQVNREIASRSFTQGLERLVTDRNTHDKVKKKALSLIAMWAHEFEDDATLGIMIECYDGLKAKNYRFEEADEPPPPQVDDDIRRREEEELQRVLEMSMHDKGGRGQWDPYNRSTSHGEGSSSGNAGSSKAVAKAPEPAQPAQPAQQAPFGNYTGGYVPARTPSPQVQTPVTAAPQRSHHAAAISNYTPQTLSHGSHSSRSSLSLKAVSRVRALYPFEGAEKGELSFAKGDIIKVVDQNYTEWWRGQLKGRTGIFPVNYVETLPDPTPDEIAKEAEQEAAVFAQAANIDKLLGMLRGIDPAKDNLTDNDEIQELYRSCTSMRPKIVKLIDKYSQKRVELISMYDTFVKARNIFDRMMEETLARNSNLYDPRIAYQTPVQTDIRPESRLRQDYRMSGYPGYDQSTPAPFTGAFPHPNPSATPQPFMDPAAYGAQQPAYGPQPYQGQQGQRPYNQPIPGGVDPAAYNAYPQQQQQPQPHPQQQQQQVVQQQSQSQPQPAQQQIQTQPVQQPIHQMQPHPVQQHQSQQQVPTQQQQAVQPLQQNGYQEPAIAAQQVSSQTQTQPQPHAQGQQQQQPQQPRVITGNLPFPFDPEATYPDPNAQAWAQYYGQGGNDPQGLVYFISVPGLKEAAPSPQVQQQPHNPNEAAKEIVGPVVASPAPEQAYQQTYGAPQQQGHPAADPSTPSGHVVSMQNGSTTSLQQVPGSASPQQSMHTLQHGQGAPSPTFAQQPSFYGSQGASTDQPSSPVTTTAMHQQLPPQQQYPANPYPVDQPHQGAGQGISGAPVPEAHPQYNAQFAQMHGQFGAMAMNEPRSPTAAAAPAQPV